VLVRPAQHVADDVIGLHHEHFLVDVLSLIQLLCSTPVVGDGFGVAGTHR
jgi:hypothetical protein